MRSWDLQALFTLILIASLAVCGNLGTQVTQNQLKRFSSYEEMESFLKTNLDQFDPYSGTRLYAPALLGRVATPMAARAPEFSYTVDDFSYIIDDTTSNTSTDFSTTNIQIEGVDEADIVKSDGKYIYVVSKNKVFIISAYPAENAKILSQIEESGYPSELFINGDKLAVLGREFVRIYDVSDKENPVLTRNISFNGYYFNSRMIGNFVYLIVNSGQIDCTYTWTPVILWPGIGYEVRRVKNLEITLPEIVVNGEARTVQANEICCSDAPDRSYKFITVMAINTQDDSEEISTETILMGTAQNLFVSSSNIYIVYTTDASAEKTIIHKIGVANGKFNYKCQGEVPGHVLNQFSMDEYKGYFRIATTTGWYGANHIYVLDEDLNITGRLENLAPGERIYSARFMGDKAYLVTFKKVDPLFVIDLSNPTSPRTLGELKIPGYSDYLHPYDETHIIGVGKDTEDAGSFAWYQGVKLALFDVSDPENPKEISKYVIGQRGTESLALGDHKAFLFSRSKNLLVIPAGDWSWQDAYVFHISVDEGIVLRGTISHQEYSVKRSLYVDNVLYTISDGLVKMNSLEDLSGINEVKLA